TPSPGRWWARFGGAMCGPGPTDDADPAVPKAICTPNNEDQWLARVALRGAIARDIAEAAAETNPPGGVLIVQAASDDSNKYCPFLPMCLNPGAPPGIIPGIVLSAQNTSEFAWAER